MRSNGSHRHGECIMSRPRDCTFNCDHCGLVRAVPCGVKIACGCKSASTAASPAAEVLPPRGRLVRFAFALIRHTVNFWRWRTPWEIAELHAICRGCEFYLPAKEPKPPTWWQRLLRITPTEGWCKKCGCGCGSAAAWLNKLAWRSEKCPEGKWPAVTLWGSPFRRVIGFITRK